MNTTTAEARELADMPRSERVRRVYDFTPLDYQAKWLDDPNSEVIISCGRQVGKTETAGVVPADYVLMNPGEDAAIFARFQETADELLRRTKQHISNSPFPEPELGVDTNNKKTLEWDNGSRILSRTLGTDAKQQRGKLPSCIVIEEAADVPDKVYQQVIRPMFATHDSYELYLISTPRGKTGFFWEEWNDDNFSKYHISTLDSPLVSEDWVRREEDRVDSITWKQEYLGEFVDEGTSYIPYDVYMECVRDLDTEIGEFGSIRVTGHPRPGVEYYGGCDVAGEGSNRTVYIVMASDGTVVHIESEEISKIPDVVGRIASLHDEFGFVQFAVDENSLGKGVVDYSDIDRRLTGIVEGVPFSTPRKSKMYKTLKAAIESGDLTFPNHGRLKKETTRLLYKYTANRHVSVFHPPGGNDDHPDALALALEAQSNPPVRKETRRRRGGTQGRRKFRH